jgi:thiamine-monophosphate kinase
MYACTMPPSRGLPFPRKSQRYSKSNLRAGRHGASAATREGLITVADLGEFGLIAAITARLPQGRAVIVGVGDDAAVLAAPDRRVVATMDLLVEGRDFRRDWSSPADIGGKAAAQNLADVAAMGAVPTALLAGLAAPGDLPVSWAEELVSGMVRECARTGATVAGGDVSGADVVMIAVTALGDLAGCRPVTRSGARPGDLVAVAGTLGRAAAGLALLAAGRTEPAGLVAAHRWPHPPYEAGPEAGALGATAMIDVSDGLLADLGHLAGASGVSIEVDTGLLLASGVTGPDGGAEMRAAAAAAGRGDPLPWLLTGGEDHALAATFPPGTVLPARWAVIGQAGTGTGITVDGRPYRDAGGWQHFR